MDNWQVEFYTTPGGQSPVEDFLDQLPAREANRVIDLIQLLEVVGIRMSMPTARQLTNSDLWKLRIRGRNHHRVLYVSVSGRRFLLLHGFSKKSQQTPRREIRIAEDRLSEWRQRNS